MFAEMNRFLIADDHAVVRAGLRQMILEDLPRAVVAEAKNAHEALEIVRKGNWDAVVLDISMPGGGLELIKDVRSVSPKLPILILSMHPEDQFAVRVLKAGANGYLTKESAPELLINALHKVMEGGTFVSSALAETLVAGLRTDFTRPPHEALSDREFEIMRMLASGATPTRIAAEQFISVKTVSTFRTRILRKLGFKTTSELTRYAIENKLLD
jgi:two-component system invasion response regulator UvrY